MFNVGDRVRRDADNREGDVVGSTVSGSGPPGNYLVDYVKVIWDGSSEVEETRPEVITVIAKR